MLAGAWLNSGNFMKSGRSEFIGSNMCYEEERKTPLEYAVRRFQSSLLKEVLKAVSTLCWKSGA